MTTEYKDAFLLFRMNKIKKFYWIFILFILIGCAFTSAHIVHTIQFEEDIEINSECILNSLKESKEILDLSVESKKCSINTSTNTRKFNCYEFNYKIAGSEYPRLIFLTKMDKGNEVTPFISSRVSDFKTRPISLAYENLKKEESRLCELERDISKNCGFNKFRKFITPNYSNDFCL